MRIAFFAEQCIPIHATSLEERPLGGTETALIRLAEILSARGHEVVVFTSHKQPAPMENKPRYLHCKHVQTMGRFDVMVLVQDWSPAFLGAPADRIFFWTGDGWEQYSTFGLGDRRVPKRIEFLLAVSEWHADTLCEKSGFPRSQTKVIGNGAHLPFFEGEEERNLKRLIYTAAPYRGLRLLIPIYQALKRKHPELELHIFSAMKIYDREQPFSGPYVGEYQALKQIFSRLPGCYFHGNVTQQVLARELMKSGVFVYPATVLETCCITAIEAQAAGCPVIASALGALPETVGEAGMLIEGEPGSAEYIERFANASDRLLSDIELWQDYSQRALRAARERFSWEGVADRFEALL